MINKKAKIKALLKDKAFLELEKAIKIFPGAININRDINYREYEASSQRRKVTLEFYVEDSELAKLLCIAKNWSWDSHMIIGVP